MNIGLAETEGKVVMEFVSLCRNELDGIEAKDVQQITQFHYMRKSVMQCDLDSGDFYTALELVGKKRHFEYHVKFLVVWCLASLAFGIVRRYLNAPAG